MLQPVVGRSAGIGRVGLGAYASPGVDTQAVRSFRDVLSTMPLLSRAIVVGAITGGAAGAIAGLLVGLVANPPTAAFAMVELGLPSAIVGALVGLLVGVVILMARRIRRRPVRSSGATH